MKKLLTLMMLAINLMAASATTYYCKPNGTGDGTSYDNAGEFTTLVKSLKAGDILYCLGGQYDYTAQINISCSGVKDNMVCIYAYPGEKPIFDFRKEAYGSKGLCPKGDYIHMKGLTIRYTGKNGLYNTGSYSIFENLDVYGNGDTGVQMKTGHSNLILNCDSHDNFDYELSGGTTAIDYGGNADGFADKQYTGGGNTYRGCRAWRNSDDGWDFFQHVTGEYGQTVIDSCICFANGPGEYNMRGHARYETDKSWFDQFQTEITVTDKRGGTHQCSLDHYVNMGNANGFKLGGDKTVHNVTVQRSLSVYNGNTFNLTEDLGAKGIDQNNNAGTMYIYNCTSYLNARNIGFDQSACGTVTFYNNISYKGVNEDVIITPTATEENNSWNLGLDLTDADFISVDTTGILAPRNENGSLPYTALMHLSKNSQCINAGTIKTGLSYYGAAPDLGCYEAEDGGQKIPPTLVVSGPKNQAVKAERSIQTVTVTAGGSATAISRTDNTYIPGVNVVVQGLKATISGTPTTPGTYVLTFVPVTEDPNTLSTTISLTVSEAEALTIGYVSNGTEGTNAADALIIAAIPAAFEVKFYDATVTGNDYSDCDAILISPVPGSNAAAMPGLKNYNLPTLLLKPWMMKSGVWDWGTAANTNTVTVAVKNPDHVIFTGITVPEDGYLKLFTKCSTNAVTAISSPTSWSNYKTLASPATNTSYISIADLTGATLNGTKIAQRYIMIGISESSTSFLTADAQTLIKNALYYILNKDIPTDISLCVEAQNDSSAVYYDIQGRQIGQPANGISIVKQGNKVTKIVK